MVLTWGKGHLCDRLIGLEVDLLILHAAPESLHEYVVFPAPFSIHSDSDVVLLERSSEGITDKLTTLICIEDLRGTISCNCLFQCLQAEAVVHGVGDSEGEDFSAVAVEDYDQVGESLGHGQIGDIDGRDLIGAVDIKTS